MNQLIFEIDKLISALESESSRAHYDILNKVLSDPDLIKELVLTENRLFEKIDYIYYYGFLTIEDKKKILDLMAKLKKELVVGSQFEEIEYFSNQLKNFMEHEKEFVDYEPGAQNREYVRLLDLMKSKNHALVVDKANLEYKSGKIFYDGRLVQGLNIRNSVLGTNVELIAEHYTDESTLKNDIYRNRIISSSRSLLDVGADPYCYLAEPGKLNNQSMDTIRKILGARNADAGITVKVIIDAKHLWIRVKRGYPAKFAIESRNIQIYAPKKQKGFVVRINNQTQVWAA